MYSQVVAVGLSSKVKPACEFLLLDKGGWGEGWMWGV